MNPKQAMPVLSSPSALDNIAYVRNMLGELRVVAENEGADMLRYLIEMAYVEAGDIQAGLRPLSAGRTGDRAAGVAVKAPGKIKF